MTELIYIVHGSTGEWSDRAEWDIVAYTSEDEARLHVEKAIEIANLYTDKELRRIDDDYDDFESSWDPKGSMVLDTGTSYWYSIVEVFDEALMFKLVK